MKTIYLTVITIFIFIVNIKAQNVGINTDNSQPNSKAILDLKSTTMGFLPPRMTSAERDNLTASLTTAEEGLEIYNLTRKCKESWTGTQWQSAVPAGTIQPFAGELLPEGWLWCDGSSVQISAYNDLYKSIGNAWGTTGITFNLPDLRGYFLRGVDNMDNSVGTGGGAIGNDPEANNRVAIAAGGNPGSKVGSLQLDVFKEHLHNGNTEYSGNLTSTGATTTSGGHVHYFYARINGDAGDEEAAENGTGTLVFNHPVQGTGTHNHNVSVSGANHYHAFTTYNNGNVYETRPKNVNVNYIIKY
ncbi:MAG: phage tail protein [Bacteroidales bacterium]